MGKTGVFLQLGYELWKLVGKPQLTSPQSRNLVFVEEDGESDGVAIAGPSSSAQLFADTFFATITSNKSVTKFF